MQITAGRDDARTVKGLYRGSRGQCQEDVALKSVTAWPEFGGFVGPCCGSFSVQSCIVLHESSIKLSVNGFCPNVRLNNANTEDND